VTRLRSTGCCWLVVCTTDGAESHRRDREVAWAGSDAVASSRSQCIGTPQRCGTRLRRSGRIDLSEQPKWRYSLPAQWSEGRTSSYADAGAVKRRTDAVAHNRRAGQDGAPGFTAEQYGGCLATFHRAHVPLRAAIPSCEPLMRLLTLP
jgi:hypothetical protein